MTEFEFIQASQLAFESLREGAMNVITVVFAYVVAAYFAGRKLTRTASVLVSVVYSLWLIGPFWGVISSVAGMLATADAFYLAFPDSFASFPPSKARYSLYLLATIPMLLGWVGSLVYMHGYIRSKDDHGFERTNSVEQ